MHRIGCISSKRALVFLCLVCIAVYACVVRCLHLLNRGYYYIVSPDSYVFQWQARRVLESEPIRYSWHGGLTYPLAYIARGVSLVVGVPIEKALDWACMFVPPILGLISIALLYMAVSKIYSRRVALLAALALAVAAPAYILQAAGYVDRDALSLVLVMAGAFTYYLSKGWHIRVHGFDAGWLLGFAALLGIELLLYVEWVWLGPVILLAILCGAYMMEFIGDLGRRMVPVLMKPDLDLMEIPGKMLAAIPSVLKASNWRPLLLLLGVSALAGAIRLSLSNIVGVGLQTIRDALRGGSSVAELRGLGPGDLLSYGAFLLAIVLGLLIVFRKRRREDWFILGWFVILFALGLFARRIFLYAAPAGCILSGMGLAYLLEPPGIGFSRVGFQMAVSDMRLLLRYAAVAAGVVLILASLAQSSVGGYGFVSEPLMAANNDWEGALSYLRDHTSPDAVVLAQWSYGYWILDMADRKPVVDNGDWDANRSKDVALVYTATDISEAVSIMEKYGADYVVFSRLDYVLLPDITKDAFGKPYGDGTSIPEEMKDSLYARSLSGEFLSGEGLWRVYPDASVERPEVVILSVK